MKRACELLQVSRSAYYADRTSGPSVREQRDTEVTAKIIRIHDDSRHTYGSPRVHHELQAQGERCSHKPAVLAHGVPPDQIARRICSHRSWEGEESDAIKSDISWLRVMTERVPVLSEVGGIAISSFAPVA